MCVSACLVLSACATQPPHEAVKPPGLEAHELLAEMARYTSWLAHLQPAQLQQERQRLQTSDPSPARDLRLAVLYGLRGSGVYDARLAASTLQDLVESLPADSVHGQLARILFAAQPDPAACTDGDRLRALAEELRGRLAEELMQSDELKSQLEGVRRDLETERQERSRLENQLKALKSLEDRLKDREQNTTQQ